MLTKDISLADVDILSIGNTIGMIGAVYAGDGRTITVLFPDEDLDGYVVAHRAPQLEVLKMSVEEWQRFLLQTDILETQALQEEADGKIVKAIVRKGQRQIDNVVSWKVYRRDGYRCRYCGNDSVPLTVDHIILWEELGPSVESNLVAACKKCNKTRGNTAYEAWLVHPYYVRVSQKLDPATREANQALVATLPNIPRVKKTRSR